MGVKGTEEFCLRVECWSYHLADGLQEAWGAGAFIVVVCSTTFRSMLAIWLVGIYANTSVVLSTQPSTIIAVNYDTADTTRWDNSVA